ncbi:tetratricopeptide repeat protein [Flavobacterium collinsii]|uniref:tetratricopeptide repeat protein n=1 Tax=Flavobacterium collinsii TaxID=1114861 RepID=UPI0037578D38
MNVTDYTYLMNKPDAITEKQADALGSVLNEFPYFQSARALRLKGLYDQNSFKYNYALKVTAAHTTDRTVLFDFITSEAFTSIQSEYYDKKLRDLLEIKVFDSEIVSFEEIKKTTEIRIDPIEQSILDSIKEAATVTFEKPIKIEEEPAKPFIEQSILDAVKEIAAVTFEEPVKTEEKPVEVVVEQPVSVTPIKAAPITVEEPIKTEQPEANLAIEQPILPPAKEPTPTFFDEIVEEEIPQVKINPIEQSILNSIKEATTVVPEQPKAVEELKEVEVPESVKVAEENLEIGQPLDFSVNEKHSFQEWLQLSRTEPIDRTEETSPEIKQAEKVTESKIETETIDEEKKKKAELIDKFIETNPKISPIKQTAITQTVQSDLNKEDNSYLMTETLARVYLEQKKYTKAIQAYEILILKYPEKISFFADRISDIKILQQNNNNI